MKSTVKKFNTLETLRILLEHPNIMFNVIRIMDSDRVRYISESQLAQQILHYSAKLDNTEQQRLSVAFDTENLLQSHLLADKDVYQGTCRLTFQEGVLSLFRLCETSLYQELTDSKLKSRLASLWRLQERVNGAELSFIDDDPDYSEFVDDLMQQLSELLSVLKQNIDRMKLLGRDLEAMSAMSLNNQQNSSSSDNIFDNDNKQEMLNQITQLFERHIKPTQNFLNHSSRLAKGSNLFESLDNFKAAF